MFVLPSMNLLGPLVAADVTISLVLAISQLT